MSIFAITVSDVALAKTFNTNQLKQLVERGLCPTRAKAARSIRVQLHRTENWCKFFKTTTMLARNTRGRQTIPTYPVRVMSQDEILALGY